MLIDVSVTMINEVFLPPGIKEYINDVSQLRLQGKNVDPTCGNTSSRCCPNSLACYTSLQLLIINTEGLAVHPNLGELSLTWEYIRNRRHRQLFYYPHYVFKTSPKLICRSRQLSSYSDVRHQCFPNRITPEGNHREDRCDQLAKANFVHPNSGTIRVDHRAIKTFLPL